MENIYYDIPASNLSQVIMDRRQNSKTKSFLDSFLLIIKELGIKYENLRAARTEVTITQRTSQLVNYN